MAYQNIFYQRSKNLIHLWDDKHGHMTIPYKKYAYRKNALGSFVALDGTKVEKVTSWDESEIKRGIIYESDIRPETRVLLDTYFESDDPSEGHRELFIDIEVSTKGGFATGNDPWQPITSIALFDRAGNRSVVILLDTAGRIQSSVRGNLLLDVVSTEEDLLSHFLNIYAEISPTIITGWNTEHFDIPYIYNRLKRVLGDHSANSLSPINETRVSDRGKITIAGVSCLDYMALYKLYTYNEEASYSLESISRKELGKGKIEYEGTLDHLYETDIEKFIKYNINDVELVAELDDKLRFLSLARGIAHKGHVPYEDVFMTTWYLDGACLAYMKRLGIVAPNKPYTDPKDEDEESDPFGGAFVKDPIPGLYDWVFDEDMASLYPSIIRTLNISPETKVGRFVNWDDIKDAFWSKTDSLTIGKFKCGYKQEAIPVNSLRQWLQDNQYTISSIGVVYNAATKGLVPAILETWMAEREEYRALAKKYGKEGNIKLAEFFDSRQHTMKIINNSLYGATGAPGFRFFDLDNAESITLTGREVTRHARVTGSEWFAKQTGISKEYDIYSDTDSTYYSAAPIIDILESKRGSPLTREEKADITYKTSQVVEKYINDSWDSWAKDHFNADSHVFVIKQEYVSETVLWLAKKRYAQKILSEKGVSISELTSGKQTWKLDVKGIDVVRSNFPKVYREFMSGVLEDILNKKDKSIIDSKVVQLREDIKKKPLLDIMAPTGVKEMSKYIKTKGTKSSPTQFRTGAPAHVKAACHYNDLIDPSKHQCITNGDKIKWAYLRTNPYALESCALKGFNDPEEIVNFIQTYIDYDKEFTSRLEKKLVSFYDAMKWGPVPSNTIISDFFGF